MIVLWYIGFTILVSMPIALPLSLYTENTFRGKMAALILAAAIMHIVGFALGFIDLGTITIPVWF